MSHLREKTARALERWRGQSGGPTPSFAAIAREAAELRASALGLGAAGLAERLETTTRLATTAPHALPAALQALRDFLESTGTDDPAPPSLVDSSVMEPSMIFLSGLGGTSEEGPPYVDALGRTMVDPSKGSTTERMDQAPRPFPPQRGVSAHRPPPVASRPPPAVSGREHSLAPPAAPPAMVHGTFLGFRAFRGSPAPPTPAKAFSSQPSGGVLGLKQQRPIAPAPPRPLSWRAGYGETPSERPPRPFPPRKGRALPRWSYFAGAAVAVVTLATAGVIVATSRLANSKDPTARNEASRGEAAPASVAKADGRLAADESITRRVHELGEETPQLGALLDLQGQLAVACRNDSARCGRGWTPLARDALSTVDKASIHVTASAPLPAWLHNLTLPADFPIHDEPALRNLFDFSTKNIAGRQNFQAKLFQCSAYADIFEEAIVKYGAPHWLAAVVYQESGCNPLATSPVSARGLWQFMPESARAYGLKVVDGDIDERLNPIKSTDAAMHFLTDLQRKLGAWDLALAAYNMGPYGVLARLAQIGEKVGFWDLEHAGLLPDETAGYVPSIEAFAIALENLGRLQFNPYGKRLESTAEVVVKPGLRLSLLARAASTTTAHIRDLNPEFLRDVVPEDVRSARVPDTEVHRAQAFLDAWSPSDNHDTCVPPDFDWGAQQFESSRYAKNCKPGLEP